MEFEMKKFSIIFLALMLALFFTACKTKCTDCNDDPTEPTECENGDCDEIPEAECEGDDCPCIGDDCPCEGDDCPCKGDDCDVEDDDDIIEKPDVDYVCESEICKIQQGEYTEGTKVTVNECVVTAIFYKEDNETHAKTAIQGVYVSDIIPEAKPYTGIYVFIKDTATTGEYKIGDKLEVKGEYKEYYENSQIEATEINKLGSADVPAPAVVDPASVATPFELSGEEYSPTANHGPDAEKYEGVLVKVKDVKITNSNLGHGAFEVAGKLSVTKDLYYYEGSRSKGVEFDSITGILVYSYDAFQLAPRSIDDFEVKIINTTISQIQKEEVATGSTVQISESVVTAIAYKSEKQSDDTYKNVAIKGLYISEIIPQAEPYTGIYVFIKSTADVDAYAVGDKLEVTGTVEEYYESTQISLADTANIKKLGTADVPAPAEINDTSKISTPYKQNGEEWEPTTSHGADAEMYESVLVKVNNVEVTNNNLGHGTFEVTGNLAISKDLYYYPGDRSIGTKFNSISGVLIYSYSAFQLAPRSGEDFVTASGN
jgi:antitoxin component YwqK of YwqJK toxin-antitoxin module